MERALFSKRFKKMSAISLYWFPAKQQTNTVRLQKMAPFTSNLVQNVMDLAFSSKSNRKWPKYG